MTTPYSVTTMVIPGLTTNALVRQIEVTDASTSSAFKQAVGTIQDIVTPYPDVPAVPLTAQQRADLENAITFLRNMLNNGYTDPNDPTKKGYVTVQMAQQLVLLFQSLKTVGVDANTQVVSFGTLAIAQKWQDLVASSAMLQDIFNFASSNTNRSLQAMIELDYVKTGNDVLAGQLDSLQSALSTTQTALNDLADLQNVHNQITINDVSTFTSRFNITGSSGASGFISLSTYKKAYTSAASAFFGAGIVPTTNALPLDPLQKFALVQSIPPDTEGLYVGMEGKLSTTVAQLQKLGRTGLYASWNGSAAGTFDLWEIGASTPSFTNIVIDNVEGHDFIYAPTDSLQGAPAGPFPVDGRPPDWAISRYNMFQTTATFHIPGGNQTFSLWSTGGSTATASSLANDFTDSNFIKNNTVQLTSGPPATYYGIKGATDQALIDRVNNLGTLIYGNWFINTVKLVPPFGASQPFWLGYDPIVKTYIIDKDHNPADFRSAVNELVRIRKALETEIAALVPITPKLAGGAEDPNSLLGKLRKVLADLKSAFVSNGQDITSSTGLISAYSGFVKWMIDNYNNVNLKGGQYQQNITFAITAGQSLNDTQKESVRNYLFLFEEYYKSASAILQKITQIIERMAQGLAR